MNSTQRQMAAVFNEWARRYAQNPDEFSEIIGSDGEPLADYGKRCALYFEQIYSDLIEIAFEHITVEMITAAGLANTK